MNPEDIENFKNWGQPLPTRDPHVQDTYEHPLSNNLKKLEPRNWRQKGNKLIADTEMGELVNFLPTDIILTGTDSDGKPILKKMDI